MSRVDEIRGIERLEGRGITAKVTDSGGLYSTYAEFAIATGYSDAAYGMGEGRFKVRELCERENEEFKVLAKGEHGSEEGEFICVIESNDGKRFLVGEGCLEITYPEKDSAPASLETRKQAEELLAELRRQAYAEGYEQGFKQASFDAEMGLLYEPTEDVIHLAKVHSETPSDIRKRLQRTFRERKQKERDRIVEQAKADIESLKGRCRGVRYGSIDDLYHISDGSYSGSYALRAKFVINKHKRTVVVLMYGAFSNKVRSRGIAKCAPDDCFNVHIGKAIALRRALGLEVPDEYLNAPQPTEVRVGDVVDTNSSYGVMEVGDKYDLDARVITRDVFEALGETRIIDDSESTAP